jgi:hypothetical protein
MVSFISFTASARNILDTTSCICVCVFVCVYFVYLKLKHWPFIDEVFGHGTCSMYGLSVLDMLPTICMALRCRTCHIQYVRPIYVGLATFNMKCMSMSDMFPAICKVYRCPSFNLYVTKFGWCLVVCYSHSVSRCITKVSRLVDSKIV